MPQARVLLPVPDGKPHRYVGHGRLDRSIHVGARPVGDEIGEELERLVQPAGLVDRAALVVDRRRGQVPGLDADRVVLREDDRDTATGRLVRRVRPHGERGERITDADVAGARPAGVLQVERQAVLRGLAAEQPPPEVDPQQRVVAVPARGPDRRAAAAVDPEARGSRQDGEVRGVEEVATRGRIAKMVLEGHVDRHPHEAIAGPYLIGRVAHDRQVGGRSPDLGGRGRGGQQADREDEREDGQPETPGAAADHAGTSTPGTSAPAAWRSPNSSGSAGA